jgi:uncharacterized protein involved in type VI secretion and phage assembly
MNPFDLPSNLQGAAYLAEVVAVNDPLALGRVQVRLLPFDGSARQDGPLWARVAVPFAGGSRGAFMIPDVGDEVLLQFISGDSRHPVVVGSLWNGAQQPPDRFGGSGDRVDRWTLVGKAGTRIEIVEEASGQETIHFVTPAGVSGELTDRAGGKLELKVPASTTITLDTAEISIVAPSRVKVQASQVEVSAGSVTVNAAMSSFSGVVRCDTLITNTVVSSTYTPGAGNVW